jgi:hypothetical protein
MGASISFDSKYKLILDAEVECISTSAASAPSAPSKKRKTATKTDRKGHKNAESESESGSESESEEGSGSGSGSDSDEETKIFTVKLTPEIIGYIRAYIRDNDFLDMLDTITEIELNEYGHGPESAIVFDSQSVIYNINDNKIEASGEWEYIEATAPPAVSAKSSRKHKSKGGGGRSHGHGGDVGDGDDGNGNGDDDDDNRRTNKNGFKTKEDELAVSEIENLISERFKEYSKNREFIIHESKTSILSLNIHSVEIVKD